MNEEQLKKDRELLSSWKEKLVYDAPGSCSFCMSEDEGADDIVTLEDCEELLEAQARVSAEEVRKKLFNDVQYIINTHQHKAGCGEVCKAFYELRDNLSPNPKQDE